MSSIMGLEAAIRHYVAVPAQLDRELRCYAFFRFSDLTWARRARSFFWIRLMSFKLFLDRFIKAATLARVLFMARPEASARPCRRWVAGGAAEVRARAAPPSWPSRRV